MPTGWGVGIPLIVQLEAMKGFEDGNDTIQHMCNPHKSCRALALWLQSIKQENQSTIQIFLVVPQRTPELASCPTPLQSACWSFCTLCPCAQQFPKEMCFSILSELLPESCSHFPLLCLALHLIVFIVQNMLACLESQAWWFSSPLLRIHPANTGPDVTPTWKGGRLQTLVIYLLFRPTLLK